VEQAHEYPGELGERRHKSEHPPLFLSQRVIFSGCRAEFHTRISIGTLLLCIISRLFPPPLRSTT